MTYTTNYHDNNIQMNLFFSGPAWICDRRCDENS